MSLLEDFLAFLSASWQGLIGLGGLLVAIYALHLHQVGTRREYLAHEVTIVAPLNEVVLDGNGGIQDTSRRKIQLLNETGIPQLVRDLWIVIAEEPQALSEEQIKRFGKMVYRFLSIAREAVVGPFYQQYFAGLADNPDYAKRLLPRAGGLVLNTYDKIRKHRTAPRGVARFLEFSSAMTVQGLDGLLAGMEAPAGELLGNYLAYKMDLFGQIAPGDGLLVTGALNLTVPPKDSREVEIDMSRFLTDCSNALGLIGNTYRFKCYLRARVHHAIRDSESDLFDVIAKVPLVDLDSIVSDWQRQLNETRPEAGSSAERTEGN